MLGQSHGAEWSRTNSVVIEQTQTFGVDAHIHAPPLGRRARGGAGIVVGEVHGLRAEGLRHRQARRHRVDREHARSADGARRLRGA